MQRAAPDEERTVLHLHLKMTEAQKNAIFAAAELDERSVNMWARFHLLEVLMKDQEEGVDDESIRSSHTP